MSHASTFAMVRPLVASTMPSVTDPVDIDMLTRFVLGVGWVETNYGKGWKSPNNKSNNMGAVTGTYKGQYFVHGDSNPDGSYVTKFRVYPTPEEGWADVARIMYVGKPATVKAALAGDVRGVSQAMYDAHYYTGVSKTPSVNVDRHAKKLGEAIDLASGDLGTLPRAPSLLSSEASGATVALIMALGFLAYRRFRAR